MKVAFSELRDFVADPKGWAAKKAASSGSPRMSYTHVTRMAIYRLHQSKDLNRARTALAGYLDSFHLSNTERRAAAEHLLESYSDWNVKEAPLVVSCQTRIIVDLGFGLQTSGQVHRVDLDLQSGGYRAVMLQSDLQEPESPLASVLQEGYAQLSGRSPELILPYHQELDGSGLVARHVSSSRRAKALAALRAAAKIAAAALSK